MERDELRSRIRTLLQVQTADLLRTREYWLEQLRSGYSKRADAELWIEAIDLVVARLHHFPLARPIPVPATRIKDERAKTSLNEFSADYLAYVKSNFAPRTLENAERVVKLLTRVYGDRNLEDLTAEDLEKFKAYRLQSGVSRVTVNVDLRTIKAAFNVATEWRRIAENPFKKVKLLKVDQQKKRTLSPEEVVTIIATVKQSWLKAIVSFDILTGLRLGEILNLKWVDFNAARSEIVVRSDSQYRVKGGKLRTIPLADDAKAILERLPRRSDFIFVNEHSKRYTNDYVSRTFKAYIRMLGLPAEIHFHRLRDTCFTWLGELNVPPHLIKELAGHSSLEITEGYLTANSAAMRREVAKLHLPRPDEAHDERPVQLASKS